MIMNESKIFGARTIFFAFVAIFFALAISEDTEAEYTKNYIWSASGQIHIDHDDNEDTYTQQISNIYSCNNKRLKDISSDGLYSVVGDCDESSSYWEDRDNQAGRKGYYLVASNYYNSSDNVNVYHECVLGNDDSWEGDCGVNSVSISDDGSRIAVSANKRTNYNSGWERSSSLTVYDTLTGNLLMEYVFCNSYECPSDYYSFSEISGDGESVIAMYENEIFYFDISSNTPLLWSDYYNREVVHQARLSDDGSRVSVSAGEFIYFYENGINTWRSQLFGQVKEMDMSADGDVIAAATDFMMIYSFETINAEPLWEYAHYQGINGLDLSSTGSHIAISSYSGLLYFLADSNSPLWITTDTNDQSEFLSVSYNGMMVYADRYLFNSINGQRIWSGESCGQVSDQGNFVLSGCSDSAYYYTVNSQIFYPVAIAGEDTTKKTSQIVQFTGQGADQDGTITKYEWDFDGNGIYDWYNDENGLYTYYYNNEGVYIATLRVTDNDGLTSTDTVTITISGVSTGELIDPKDDDEIDQEEDSDSDSVTETEDNEEIETPNVAKDDDDDEGFLPSIGFITAIGIISIIGLMRRYN